MKYFLPDSQDLVDPSFDFERESRSPDRVRQRDDLYAHEVFGTPAFDGILVSKAIVDGNSGAGGRYSIAQRHRLLRRGVKEFFRLPEQSKLTLMGDCGAFSYVNEAVPPYSVDDVLSFYDECDFDYGISVDHVILGYNEAWDKKGAAPEEFVARQNLTLELADEFLRTHKKAKLRFGPIGVAQGWSPKSYAASVKALQKMGYRYIAVGGMVPLKTTEILASLEAISKVRRADTKLHLLGVTRLESLASFEDFGAVSLDSTSPLRQAFKDDKDNYYTMTGAYSAIRVPQIEGNAKLQKRIRAGEVSNDVARKLERACLDGLKRLDAGKTSAKRIVPTLIEYEQLLGGRKDHSAVYEEVLEAKPWKSCKCDVCQKLGYHVILFRGAERNRRRGFHNVWTFYRRLQREIKKSNRQTQRAAS